MGGRGGGRVGVSCPSCCIRSDENDEREVIGLDGQTAICEHGRAEHVRYRHSERQIQKMASTTRIPSLLAQARGDEELGHDSRERHDEKKKNCRNSKQQSRICTQKYL